MTELENIKKHGNNKIVGSLKILETSLLAYKEILGITKFRKVTAVNQQQEKEVIKTFFNEIILEQVEQKSSFYSNFKYFDKLQSKPEHDKNNILLKNEELVQEILHSLIMNMQK